MRGFQTFSKWRPLVLLIFLGMSVWVGRTGVVLAIEESAHPDEQTAENILAPGEEISAPNVPHYLRYDPGNQRDPFSLPGEFFVEGIDGDQSKGEAALNPQSIRVLGIVSGKLGYQAMLQMGNERPSIVEVGSVLDPDHQVIKAITGNTVVLAIPSFDGKGREIMREKVLRLADFPNPFR